MRAADVLSVTQPAVSKTLRELEEIVGRPLLERTSKGVLLTAAGRVLLRHAGESLRVLSEGLDQLAADPEGEGPALRIGALPNVAATLLPTALLHLAEHSPRARITIRTGSNAQLIAGLRQGVLDLVIGRLAEPSDMQGLSFEQLFNEPLLFVVRAGHPLARLAQIAASQLRPYRLVLPDSGTRVREAADRFFVSSGIGLPVRVIETIDITFGRAYVQRSDAIWFVPRGAIENDLREGRFMHLPIDTRITEGPVGLTRRADSRPMDELDYLVDQVRHAARSNRSPKTGRP